MIRSTLQFGKRHCLEKWLNSPIETLDGICKDDNNITILHKHFINQLCNTIDAVLQKNNYYISNKKLFRNEITRYIYNISDDSSYG